MRTLIATTLAAGTLAVVPLGFTTAPAHANPCSQSSWVEMHKLDAYVAFRKNGDNSIYNKTRDNVTRTITYGYSRTYQVQKSWEVGASAGISWGVVSADVNSKYGRTYTQGTEVSKSEATTMVIRPDYTGWTQLIVYRHPIVWKKLRDQWHPATGTCKVITVAKALWQPPKHQMVPTTKKGHRYPS